MIKTTQRERIKAAAITAAIVASMVIVLIGVNVVALRLPYQGQGAAWVVLVATVIADGLLIFMVYGLLLDLLRSIAAAPNTRARSRVPGLVGGLLGIYTLILWTILAPLLNRLGRATGLALLVDGWSEPESQLFRTAVVFTVIVLSWYWFIGRYRNWTVLARARARVKPWPRWKVAVVFMVGPFVLLLIAFAVIAIAGGLS